MVCFFVRFLDVLLWHLKTFASIHSQTVTSGNVHDSQARDYLLLGGETRLYADSAYSSAETDKKLEKFGIDNQVQKKGVRGHPLCDKTLERNAEIAVIRSGGERPFATYKRNYGLRRTRFMGLAKNMTFFGIAAIAHNIQKAGKFLTQFGVREPISIG